MRITDSTFLITGGASGLGEACARHIVQSGGNAVIADLNASTGAALVAQLGASARFDATDVTSEADVTRAVALAVESFGGLHGVINCAGIAPSSRVLAKQGPHDLALFAKVININLIGTFNVIRLAAAAMASNAPDHEGERGVIVNTASVAAYEGQIGQAAYAASKGGVASMTLPLARDLSRHGIRVVAIAPGIFDTPMLAAMPPEVRESLGQQVPFPPRLGKPDEFAQLVEQIITNPMLNGEVIRLDGAIRMGPK
jgi:NAD(P)-dependent dehydrogenase (short-subunit alcohol dehydrogenase family)